jgi:hypothetical protein
VFFCASVAAGIESAMAYLLDLNVSLTPRTQGHARIRLTSASFLRAGPSLGAASATEYFK